jgi:hypothetical protein
MHLQRGRNEDVQAGLEVILRQMDRMRLISERLRGMRQEPRALRSVNLTEVLQTALRTHPIPGEDSSRRVIGPVPYARAHTETILEVFEAIRRHLLDAGSASKTPPAVRVELRHDAGGKSASIELTIEGMAIDPLRPLLAEVARVLAPTGQGLRADFREAGALLAIDFPVEEALSRS